jgi:hypothetical protein
MNHNGKLRKFVDQFFEIEKKYDLFSLESDGTKYWDIVRCEVFYHIYYDFFNIELTSTNANEKKKNWKSNLFRIIYFFKFYQRIFFVKKEYLFFTASRNIDELGMVYDINLQDIFSLIEEKALIIETFSKARKLSYNFIYNDGLILESKLAKIIKRKSKIEHDIVDFSFIFSKEFGKRYELESLIKQTIYNYDLNFNYYVRLFKLVKPSAIFMVQNGFQKGMFSAANHLNIPITEVQHGLIGFYHPSYSYPNNIIKNQLKTIPKYFFTYSNFWTKSINFPVHKTIPIGNSNVSNIISKGQCKYEITILYANGYNLFLLPLIEEIIKSEFKGRLCIKLHPSLFSLSVDITEYFKLYSFIDVVRNEISIEKLLTITKTVLVIQSTSVYQALQNNVFVFLYKRMDYEIHEDIFENPLVKLVDSAEEILNTLKEIESDLYLKQPPFFDSFNEKLFNDFLKGEL